MAHLRREKVAIVGSGCAGMGAAWALKDTQYEVHVFEQADRLGGHTNTQPFQCGEKTIQVDTGFIVMNSTTYPNLLAFLKEVDIEPTNTQMTFGVSRNRGEFEWSGEKQGVFAQKRNLFRPQHWRLIFDIVRFNQFALDLLAEDDDPQWRLGTWRKQRKHDANITIGQYLDREGYSMAFRDDYLIPMTAAVWSTSPDKASLEFPAKTLIRFMWNHHLLTTMGERPPWLTIPGGSRRYIEAILKQYPEGRLHIHTSSRVANVLRPAARTNGLVNVTWSKGTDGKIEQDHFNHVILACHGDEVLPLLAKHGSPSSNASGASSRQDSFVRSSNGVQYVTEEEHEILSAFETTANTCYLHSDLSLMPTRRAVWTAWNYLVTSSPSKQDHPAGVSLTYNMNILQHYPEDQYGPVLVTMNPDIEPKAELTQGKFEYTHPLYTVEAVRAQDRLEQIQNKRGVSYCGAWTKYGFHEDGFSSGLRVATEHLGAKLPFEFVDSTYSAGHTPTLIWKDHLLRVFVLLPALFWIRILERILGLPFVAPFVQVLAIIGSRLLNSAEYFGIL
ncbi:Putative amine oxidase, FAD/NAD(P)-binding domain superfamily [Septoria linicola]|uniref:Amine oxidase, FAD/NAD(P)-binding domain superfamily n=1 Tax=Septoria linicola TaxID=215465 RepID=A0A9Q9AIX9_9PEZI|nr:putative amine oxidase, FAD/NAD(P)-binding domain superfamily [Septoria linicola]USW48684.1 Putative amine oxidase, FAD/NAD(P)-binding domain superfamily [Septoria linicola]